MENQEEYNKLIKFNEVREYCIYCRKFVRKTFDFDDVFPSWGAKLQNKRNLTKIQSYHDECKKEMEKWDDLKSEDQLIEDIKAEYQIDLVNKYLNSVSNFFEGGPDFGFEGFNWYFKEEGFIAGISLNEIKTYEVPKQILKFDNLKHFEISNSNLKEFPKDLEKLNKLESLSLRFNTNPINYDEVNEMYIRTSYVCVCNLKFSKLKSLNLTNVSLCNDKDFKHFPNIEEITLTTVFSPNIRFKFKNTDKIKVLRISNADIWNWSYDFSQLINLKEIVIKDSNILEIPLSLCKLKNLSKIEFRGNKNLNQIEGIYNNSAELTDKIFQVHNGKAKDKELFRSLVSLLDFNRTIRINDLIEFINEGVSIDNLYSKMRINLGIVQYVLDKAKSEIIEICKNETLSNDQIEKVMQILIKSSKMNCGITLQDSIKLVKENVTLSNILDLIWKYEHICIFYQYCPDVLAKMIQKKLELADFNLEILKWEFSYCSFCESLWDYENDTIEQKNEKLLEELHRKTDESNYVSYYWKCKKAHYFIHGEDSLYFPFERTWDLTDRKPFYPYANTLLFEMDLSQFNSEEEFEEFVMENLEEKILENWIIIKSLNKEFSLYDYRKVLHDDWEKALDILKLNNDERELVNFYLYFEPNNELNSLKKVIDFANQEITTENVYKVVKYSLGQLINRKNIKDIFFLAVKELGGSEREATQLVFIIENVNIKNDLEKKRSFFTKFSDLKYLLELIRIELSIDNFFLKYKDFGEFLSFTAKIHNLIGIGCKNLGLSDKEISEILEVDLAFLSYFNNFEELVDYYRK